MPLYRDSSTKLTSVNGIDFLFGKSNLMLVFQEFL